MTRVSLTEEYDDRSVISKLKEMDARIAGEAGKADMAVEQARAAAQSAQQTADRFAGTAGDIRDQAVTAMNLAKADMESVRSSITAQQAEVDRVKTVAEGVLDSVTALEGDVQRLEGTVDTALAHVVRTDTVSPQTVNILDVQGLSVAQAAYIGRIDETEIAGMAMEESDGKTLLSNDNGIVINGRNTDTFVDKNSDQVITGLKKFRRWDMTVTNVVNFEGSEPDNWKAVAYVDGEGNKTPIVQFKPTSIQRKIPIASNATTVEMVTKGYVSDISTTNNLFHKEGDESASGWKQMSVLTTYHTLGTRGTSWYVLGRIARTGQTSRFPIMLTDRYWGITGQGICTWDGSIPTVWIRGESMGSQTTAVEFRAYVSGDVTYLVCRRTSSAGSNVLAYIPWVTFSTSRISGGVGSTKTFVIPEEDVDSLGKVYFNRHGDARGKYEYNYSHSVNPMTNTRIGSDQFLTLFTCNNTTPRATFRLHSRFGAEDINIVCEGSSMTVTRRNFVSIAEESKLYYRLGVCTDIETQTTTFYVRAGGNNYSGYFSVDGISIYNTTGYMVTPDFTYSGTVTARADMPAGYLEETV